MPCRGSGDGILWHAAMEKVALGGREITFLKRAPRVCAVLWLSGPNQSIESPPEHPREKKLADRLCSQSCTMGLGSFAVALERGRKLCRRRGLLKQGRQRMCGNSLTTAVFDASRSSRPAFHTDR